MNHLSNKIKDDDFKNVDVIEGSYHHKLGKNDDVLYLNLEPYNKPLTDGYADKLIDKIIKRKQEILRIFNKKVIVIDDLITIYDDPICKCKTFFNKTGRHSIMCPLY